MTSDIASETSPLLGEQRIGDAEPSKDSGNGTLKSNCSVSHREEEAGKDSEVDAARLAQFEGVPEAQKLLKYIVPAVSIGVWTRSHPRERNGYI